MAGFFRLREIEARKRALAAESEIYRQTLKVEVHNLRLRGVQMRQKVMGWRSHPLVNFAALAGALVGRPFRRRSFSRPRNRWLRLAGVAFMGWRTYRRVRPVLQSLVQGARERPHSHNGWEV